MQKLLTFSYSSGSLIIYIECTFFMGTIVLIYLIIRKCSYSTWPIIIRLNSIHIRPDHWDKLLKVWLLILTHPC